MHEVNIASCTRIGNATVFAANKAHPMAKIFDALLDARRNDSDRPAVTSPTDQPIRSWLAQLGAPLLLDAAPSPMPQLEKVFAQGVQAARRDASIARSLPVFIWKNRALLQPSLLLQETRRLDQRQTVGFFLELTGILGGDEALIRLSERLRDGRIRKDRDFFVHAQSTYAQNIAKERTPALAKKWHLTMNLSLETFASTFRRFVPDAPVSN